jgi:hypothetical protein
VRFTGLNNCAILDVFVKSFVKSAILDVFVKSLGYVQMSCQYFTISVVSRR